MSFLLDTNIVSEIRKEDRANPGVRAWFATVPATDIYVSALLFGEVQQGVERLRHRDPVQTEVFVSWLTQLQRDFAGRALPVTAAVAQEWGRISSPDPLSVIDTLLAATAKVHRMTLVTRNTKDIARTGVTTLNPFS